MIFAREYQNNADLTRAEFTAAESRPILGFRDLPNHSMNIHVIVQHVKVIIAMEWIEQKRGARRAKNIFCESVSVTFQEGSDTSSCPLRAQTKRDLMPISFGICG